MAEAVDEDAVGVQVGSYLVGASTGHPVEEGGDELRGGGAPAPGTRDGGEELVDGDHRGWRGVV